MTYEPFLPGHYYWSVDPGQKWYYRRDWMQYDAVKDNPASVEAIRDGLTAAVKRQLMSDVPYGVLLSGGLDSSVISALAEKFSEHRIEDDSKTRAYWPRLHSFAVGLKGAPDLAKAKLVADHIGTVHHEINYTIQEGLDAIRDVIYFIETYDVTTVRASTPMYLLARVIKSMGIKMVLSQPRTSTMRPSASFRNCICTTACVPTRVSRLGALKVVYRSSTKSSLMSPCVPILQQKCAQGTR